MRITEEELCEKHGFFFLALRESFMAFNGEITIDISKEKNYDNNHRRDRRNV